MKLIKLAMASAIVLSFQLTQGQQKVTIDYGKELLPKLTIKRGNMFRAEVNNTGTRNDIAGYVEQGYPLYLGHRNYNEPSSAAGSCGKPAEFYKENGTIKFRLNENMTALRAFAKTQDIQVWQQFNRVPLSGSFKDETFEGEFDIFTFQQGWYRDGEVAKGRPDGLLPIKEQYDIFADVVSKYIVECDKAAGINSIWTGFDEPAHTMGFRENVVTDDAREENVRRYVEFFAPLAIKLKAAGKTIGGIQLNSSNAGKGLYEVATSELKKRNAYIDYFTIQHYLGGKENKLIIDRSRSALKDPYWAKTKVFFNRYGYWKDVDSEIDQNNLRNTSREMVVFLNAEKIIVDNADIMYGYAIEANEFSKSKDEMLGQIGMFLNKMPQDRKQMSFENSNLDGFSSANTSVLNAIVWNKSGTANLSSFQMELKNLPANWQIQSIRKGSGTSLSNVGTYQFNQSTKIISGIALKPYEFLLITVNKGVATRFEAESYSAMSGIQAQTTTDAGGGSAVGYINNNDYCDYSLNVATAGTYSTQFRVASAQNGGTIQIIKGTTLLGSVTIPTTGGWQTWSTINGPSITLSSTGTQTIRLKFVNTNTTGSLMNLNWWECTGVGSVKSAKLEVAESVNQEPSFKLFPNPASEKISLNLSGFSEKSVIKVFNMNGKLVYSITSEPSILEIPVKNWKSGLYCVQIKSSNKLIVNKLVIE